MNITEINARIAQVTAAVLNEQSRLNEFKRQIQHCESRGRLYSCQNNTGKKLNTWRDYRNRSETTLKNLNAELASLQKTKSKLAAGLITQGQAEQEAALASGAQADSTLKWVLVAAGALLLIGGIIYGVKKLRKK